MWIRIPLLIKVMQMCGHWSTDTPWLHFEPAFYSAADADQDPASQKDAALYETGSGSALQFFLYLRYNTVFIVHSYAKINAL
jgi:hypothetical protein